MCYELHFVHISKILLKCSLAGKAVPNIPQNMPILGHQYVMGQASLPFYVSNV